MLAPRLDGRGNEGGSAAFLEGGPLASRLAAAGAAVALLVAVPLGVRLGLAMAQRAGLGAALDTRPLVLDLATACAWVGCLFLPLAVVGARYDRLRKAPLAVVVFLLALGVGAWGWYRLEPAASRLLFAAQYALLVVMAFLLFDFLACWLVGNPMRTRRR